LKDNVFPKTFITFGGWLKIEGRIFVGACVGYVGVAAILEGRLSAGLLIIRVGMAAATAVLVGVVYRHGHKYRHPRS
jgi:hypothetical protein